MRPKARGLAQHGGVPGWLEESDPARCDFVRDGWTNTACLFRTVPIALPGAAQLRAEGFPAAVILYMYKCTQPSVMSYVTQGIHFLVL
jgi:hypothetical protein